MLNRVSETMRILFGCTAVLVLANGCGTKEDTQVAPVLQSHAPIQSAVVADKPALVNVVPAPLPVSIEDSVPSVEEPKNFEGWMKHGKRLAAERNIIESLRYFDKARELRPDSIQPDIESARALLTIGRGADARVFVDNALEADESSSYAWNTLGRVELLQGNLEEAVVAFQRAGEENEDNAFAWNNLGFTLSKMARYEEAATALEKATSSGDPNAFMWNNLAMAYEKLDKLDLARAAYRQASDLGSDKAEESLLRLEGVTSIAAPEVDVEREAGGEPAIAQPLGE